MSYENDRKQIRKAFEDGMDLLFKTMFNEDVLLYLMDDINTRENVYRETEEKTYKTPYSLTAKVTISRVHGEEPVQTIEQTATFVLPNKQLVDLGIPHENDADLEILQRAAIKYKDYFFLVDKVTPRVQVADTFLFYDFVCTTKDKDLGMKYVLPE